MTVTLPDAGKRFMSMMVTDQDHYVRTAQKSADGSVAVQFGGCDGKMPNYLPIMPGWNYMVRLYRPHAEILNGGGNSRRRSR